MDLKQHLVRQMVWSKATFGPGPRTEGVLDHLRKEIDEVRKSGGEAEEWVDLVILSLDGLTRELWAGKESTYPYYADMAAQEACEMILHKQAKNERRDWPDWRTADPNKAIEHIRGKQD